MRRREFADSPPDSKRPRLSARSAPTVHSAQQHQFARIQTRQRHRDIPSRKFEDPLLYRLPFVNFRDDEPLDYSAPMVRMESSSLAANASTELDPDGFVRRRPT